MRLVLYTKELNIHSEFFAYLLGEIGSCKMVCMVCMVNHFVSLSLCRFVTKKVVFTHMQCCMCAYSGKPHFQAHTYMCPSKNACLNKMMRIMSVCSPHTMVKNRSF